MSTAPKKRYTPQEYLELERRAEYKSEYLDGEIFAMAWASRMHSLIASNLIRQLGNRLQGGPCEVHGSDLRVRVPGTDLFTYPDVTVICGDPVFFEQAKPDTLVNPQVLFEVLSPSTEAFDRGRKFAYYRSLESLQEYVFVSQERRLVEVYSRSDGEGWILREAKGPEGVLRLESLDREIPLSEIYAKVDFTEVEETPDPPEERRWR